MHRLIGPVAEALGCELWGLEYLTGKRRATLRIYIDGEQGVTLEDCERVSRQVSSVLDVEDPISGEYVLEVSSPGMDRPLFTLEQFARYVGEIISLRLHASLDGRRRMKGRLKAAADGQLLMEVDGQEYRVPVESIDKAKLVPQFD